MNKWNAAVERCGQLNEANQESGSAIAGYEVVSKQEQRHG